MSMIKTEKFILPSHWGSYLVNSDPSGLEEEEIKEVDAWVVATMENNNYASFHCTMPDGDAYIARVNDANNLLCDVMDFNFLVTTKKEKALMVYGSTEQMGVVIDDQYGNTEVVEQEEADHDKCPQCNSSKIDYGDCEVEDGTTLYRVHKCDDCGTTWDERYELVSVHIERKGDKSA